MAFRLAAGCKVASRSVGGFGLVVGCQQSDEQAELLFRVRLVDDGFLHEAGEVSHEGDGLGVFNDGAGKRRAIGEVRARARLS